MFDKAREGWGRSTKEGGINSSHRTDSLISFSHRGEARVKLVVCRSPQSRLLIWLHITSLHSSSLPLQFEGKCGKTIKIRNYFGNSETIQNTCSLWNWEISSSRSISPTTTSQHTRTSNTIPCLFVTLRRRRRWIEWHILTVKIYLMAFSLFISIHLISQGKF